MLANVPPFVLSLFAYFTTDSKSDALGFLPFPMWLVSVKITSIQCIILIDKMYSFNRFPFNMKSLGGYLFAFSLDYLFVTYVIFNGASVFALVIGCYLFAIATIKDMSRTLRSINKKYKSTDAGRTLQMKKLSEFIQTYTDSKQLSKNHDDCVASYTKLLCIIYV